MKTLIGCMVMAAMLVGAPLVASAGTKAGPAVAKRSTKPLHKMTKQEKIRAFFKMVREMGKVPKSCRLKGKKLWGKVKIVKSFPDFKVKRVSSFPDLKVKWVSSFPDKCGKWKKVSSFPDFKIKWVTSFPDFTIKIVSSFPGVR
jgi:hypothetical protein